MRIPEYIKLLAPVTERMPIQNGQVISAAVILLSLTLLTTLIIIISDNKAAKRRSKDAETIYKDVRRQLEQRDRKRD